jgi:hypothetical protein
VVAVPVIRAMSGTGAPAAPDGEARAARDEIEGTVPFIVVAPAQGLVGKAPVHSAAATVIDGRSVSMHLRATH